jgi:hypothetical protein
MNTDTEITLGVDLVGVLRKAKRASFSLQNALLELIDNSVDEGATIIQIREDSGDLIISDNGRGFSDIGSALIVGKSSKTDSIGRYGVGLKDACIRYSNTTVIESNGYKVSVPWNEIISDALSGQLILQEIPKVPITHIILRRFRANYSKEIQDQEIRRVYHPLISGDGLIIQINGASLGPLKMPVITEAVNADFKFNGKLVSMTGGTYATNDPMKKVWKGYNPYYKGRLIGPGNITNRGTGDEGCTSFFFMVNLLDGEESWSLATNKDAVDELDELLDYIYQQYTREALIRGAEASRDIALRDIEENINKALSGGSGNITRPRSGEKPGAVKPTQTGAPKRRTNSASSSGAYSADIKSKKGKLKFRFEHQGGDALGEINEMGKSIIISANLDNPFIREHKDNESMILMMAKLCFCMFRQVRRDDMLSDNYISSIMMEAGQELSVNE